MRDRGRASRPCAFAAVQAARAAKLEAQQDEQACCALASAPWCHTILLRTSLRRCRPQPSSSLPAPPTQVLREIKAMFRSNSIQPHYIADLANALEPSINRCCHELLADMVCEAGLPELLPGLLQVVEQRGDAMPVVNLTRLLCGWRCCPALPCSWLPL